jgi:hypothetical protein
MTSMAEALGYGWAIELSNPAWVHELRDPHTGKWINSPGDVTHPLPKPGPVGSVARYKVPDPARLRQVKSGYRDPADHPFWREHPVSPENIVAAYDAADAGAREQGRRWYADVSDLANKITGGDPEKGGILLSTYSPQTSWPINMFNAAESARRGHAIGPGEGIKVTTQQKDKAQKALDGQGIEELMQTAKTHSFGALIAHGDDQATDPYGHVVVDTHAVNVALGGTMRGKALEKAPINDARQHEYVADQYRAAAKIISEREGKLMKPHQLQAITWLAQQRANQGLDAAGMSPTQRGRATMTKNAWARWMKYADEQGIPVVIGSTGIELAYQALMAQVIELMGEDSMAAALLRPPPFPDGLAAQAIDLAFDPDEPRAPDGRWMRIGHDLSLTSDAHVVSAEAFSLRFGDAFRGSPYAAFVNHYTPEQIRAEHMIPVLAAGGKAGLLIHDHGDGRIEPTGLFNVSGRKGMGLALLRMAIDKHHANYVECYGPALNKMYATLGFADTDVFPFDPAQASPSWDAEKFDHPDYHLMALPGTVAAANEDDDLDLDGVRAAVADDPAFSEDSWAAALAVFGITAP